MNTLISNIAASMNSSVEAEITALRDEANNKIGHREAARSFAGQFLHMMPEMVTGTFLVKYFDDRGNEEEKQESKNNALWLIAILTTCEVGHTSYDLLGSIFSHWSKETLNIEWDTKSARKVAKQFVIAMQQCGILKNETDYITFVGTDGIEHKSPVAKLDPEFLAKLDCEVDILREKTHMVCRPLHNQPNDWVNNYTGIGADANMRLVKAHGQHPAKMDKRVLKAVNKLQAVRYSVAPCMVEVAYDILDNKHVFNPSEEELQLIREVIRCAGGEFYFPVTMDARGRMYYRGGVLQPQAEEFARAALQFADGKALGETGGEALAIHAANCFGIKGSLEDRINWVDDNLERIISCTDHVALAEQFPKAEKYLALVCAHELKKLSEFVNNGFGDVSDFVSNIICHQDGSCNGIQHMAAITRDHATASAVNCTPAARNDYPADLYGLVARKALDAAVSDAIKDVMATFNRDMAKNPVMITGYGASPGTVQANTAKYLEKHGADPKLGDEIGTAYVDAINTCAAAVGALTDAIKSRVGDAIKSGTERFSWTTMDGFVATTEYRDIEALRVRAGKFTVMMEEQETSPLDEVKTVGAMAPNFVHSIDATHLRMVVNACDHPLVTIHDSIGSHAGTYFETNKILRNTFVAVHTEYDHLNNLCESLGARTPKFRGTYDIEGARQAIYMFS